MPMMMNLGLGLTKEGMKVNTSKCQKKGGLKPPFVITDNLRLRHVFSGYILLTPSINAEEVFAKYLGHNLAILSEHCIGSIHVNRKDTYLHVFSDNNYLKCLDILQEDFCFAGYTDNIGRMEFIDTVGCNG